MKSKKDNHPLDPFLKNSGIKIEETKKVLSENTRERLNYTGEEVIITFKYPISKDEYICVGIICFKKEVFFKEDRFQVVSEKEAVMRSTREKIVRY